MPIKMYRFIFVTCLIWLSKHKKRKNIKYKNTSADGNVLCKRIHI